MIRVFIDGSAGTTGLQVRERLLSRRDVELVELPEHLRKDSAARKDAFHSSDVVFLCLPDDAAREAATFADPDTIVIDASTAHRTSEGWAYGFPELGEKFRRAIQTGKRIANPGCYASGFLSLVYPLVGVAIPPDYPVVCHAVSGYSGAGKKGIEQYERGEDPLLAAPRLYALEQKHKHLKEMQAISGLTYAPVFDPYICNFYAGMTVCVPLHVRLMLRDGDKNWTKDRIFSYLTEYYARHRFISVTQNSENGFLSAQKLVGTNNLEIFVGGNEEQILLVARLDNLGKGASGAAIQNMNLALGLDEGEGL